MADDSERDHEGQEQEGVKILPGEWLRRLAHRRTREERRSADEHPAPPTQLHPDPAPTADLPGDGERSVQAVPRAAEPEPADAVAASAARARRQLKEQISQIRSGLEEAVAAEQAHRPVAEVPRQPAVSQPPAAVTAEPAAPQPAAEQPPSPDLNALEKRLHASAERRLDLELGRIRADSQAVTSQLRAELEELFQSLRQQVQSELRSSESDSSDAALAEARAAAQRIGVLSAEIETVKVGLEERIAELAAQAGQTGDVEATVAAAEQRLREAIESDLAEGLAGRVEEARKLVIDEAQAARTSLSEAVGRVTKQLRASEEWFEQRGAGLAAQPLPDVGPLEAHLTAAMEAINATAKAAEARIAEKVDARVLHNEAEARARLAAETENARAVLRKQAESIGKGLAEQERKAAEVLSAKAQRRERVLARDEQSRTARRAREAIREAERASRDAEERIVRSTEKAIADLKKEMEQQRSEAAQQAQQAQQSLTRAVEEGRKLAEARFREDLNRMLAELRGQAG